MDASQVVEAQRCIEQFRHTPCRECQSRQTVPLIYQGLVIVSCENCGGATPKGRLSGSAPATA
jgi:translation initiation factor 2 beta subunit (eIF-2beta)/eIF-5